MAKRDFEVENIVARVADSLDRSVLPHVEDHYARQQLRAMREMLLNLGTRVEWRREDGAASGRMLRDALDALSLIDADLVCGVQAIANLETGELSAQKESLAGVIERVYGEPDDRRTEALAVIWRVIRFEFDAEAQRVRTGKHLEKS